MRDDEEEQLRSAALQNASIILAARQRIEGELIRTNEALERRTAELAHSVAILRATLESTADGMLVTDNERAVTDHNDNYVRLWRIPAEVLALRNHQAVLEFKSGLFARPEAFLATTEDIYRQGLNETHDVLELLDGRVIERSTRIQRVDGRGVGRVWNFRDVTAYRQAETAARRLAEERTVLLGRERAAREEAERQGKIKDEFLATLSHELRTPLSAILGWSMILRQHGMDEGELQRGLETIERNARLQAQLIEDLLDMSRITSGMIRLDIQPLAPMVFIEAALETVRPAAEAKGVRLERMLDPHAGPIAGDPSRMQQVIWNLVSNAIKFTPRGGKVQVVLSRVNSHLEISVADTGIGIDPEFLPHAFERFRQADATTTRVQGGLGLGLAIVKSLVELHGGTVRVASAGEGQGATFTVLLPLTVARVAVGADPGRHPSTPPLASYAFEQPDLSGLTLLVVDDEPDAREMIERILAHCGAEVISAGSALEALAVLERCMPDVLISDIGMPGIDGYELLRRVRSLSPERGAKLPAIALTAFARSEDRTRALQAGYLVHVAKPVEPAELLATVASLAGRTG